MKQPEHKVIYSLFDGSGLAAIPWAEAGHTVYCFNADDANHGSYREVRVTHPNIKYINTWIDIGFNPVEGFGLPVPDFIISFPDCTHLANSGSGSWERKREMLGKDFQNKAAEIAKVAFYLAEQYGCPYVIENPVGRLSTLWRKPDYIFHPYQFGGYLPEDDIHPYFPEYIMARDAYPKKTCLWTGNGFVFPEFKPVPVVTCDDSNNSVQHKKLGGKSAKTKLIRSLTPRAFAKAIFEANK